MKTLLAVLFTLLSGPALAEQVIESGPYKLHYMAMVTYELPPQVAEVYGITRSRKQGIVVLNLQHVDQPQVSVASKVSGRIRNLIGQERLDELREVREQDAIYWIATFDFSHLETMRFDFQVDPDGPHPAFPVHFSQQFYRPPK